MKNNFGGFPSGWRTVWLLVMFDLPTFTKEQRRASSRYRNILLKDGFSMMQYSVYYRHCVSNEHAEVHSKNLELNVPAKGEVRFITITDKQFAKMHIIKGKKSTEPEKKPAQLEFF
jgi:CRISPR-associated protein Cas2